MGAETPPSEDELPSKGRKDNAAQHVNPAEDNAGAERYPPVSKDDGVESAAARERRTFEDSGKATGDGGPDPSVNQGRMGPAGVPAEGKR